MSSLTDVSLLRAVWAAASCLLAAMSASAGDWPQILGPSRNGVASGEKLAEKWPAGGPKPAWTYPLGSGYAGPAASSGKVVVFHRVQDKERVESLDLASGRSLWKADFPATYRPGIDPDNGPRCVPLIADGSVYVFGAAGDLHSVAMDGKPRWSRSLYDDYGGDEGYFGAGSSPILVAGKLLVNVGGSNAGIVALDPATGKTLWQASKEAASYSSPALAKVGSKEQAIFVTRLNCVLVDPESGEVTKLVPFGARGPTVNAATPLVIGDKLFLTASYGIGSVYASLVGDKATPIWDNDESLSSQYATPIEHKGHLYGIHGREDGTADLRCVELATGKVKWSQPDYGVAHIILADNKLLVLNTGGRLALVEPDPSAYREPSAAELGESVTRALPALSNGRLLVRAGSGGGKLICLPVGQ